jgi:hypothetical protein
MVGEPVPPREAVVPPIREPAPEREEHPVVGWAKAIFGGIGDTAKQALDEGRRGAAEAYDDGWRRFDDKTRYRRRTANQESDE